MSPCMCTPMLCGRCNLKSIACFISCPCPCVQYVSRPYCFGTSGSPDNFRVAEAAWWIWNNYDSFDRPLVAFGAGGGGVILALSAVPP